MPHKKILFLAIAALLACSGCKKDAGTGDNSPKSTWTFDGVNYNEGNNQTSFSSGSLSASDNNSNGSISIQFGARPADGSFSTTDLSDTALLPSNRCSIDLSTASKNYKSSGSSSGGAVLVSVNGGKITATFTNIEMKSVAAPYTQKSLSGTLIEK